MLLEALPALFTLTPYAGIPKGNLGIGGFDGLDGLSDWIVPLAILLVSAALPE